MGALGFADPAIFSPLSLTRPVATLSRSHGRGTERRGWREGCLRTGALTARTSAKVRISSQRDSEAAG